MEDMDKKRILCVRIKRKLSLIPYFSAIFIRVSFYPATTSSRKAGYPPYEYKRLTSSELTKRLPANTVITVLYT